MKRLTQEQFVERSKLIHDNKYDYSLVNYVNSSTEVVIKCNIHDTFLQKPKFHMKGNGCKICGTKTAAIKRIKNIEEDLELAKKIHKNKFDYSLVEYEGQKHPVKIICPKHGIFEQSLDNHINQKSDCPFCVMNMSVTAEEILKLNAHEDIKNCKYNNQVKYNWFLFRCRKVHGNLYQYRFSTYQEYNTPMEIICPNHGLFYQCLGSHINNEAGCPQCSVISKGEFRIKEILNFYKIKYIPQHSFDSIRNPKTNRKLLFDFYLPEYNLLIEFDGEQHFPQESIKKLHWGKEKDQQIEFRDEIKNKQCSLQNKPLLRIKYTDFLNIEKILIDVLNLYLI